MSELINGAVDDIKHLINMKVEGKGEIITPEMEEEARAKRLFGVKYKAKEKLSISATLKNPFDIIFYRTLEIVEVTTRDHYDLCDYVDKLIDYIKYFKNYITPFSSNELPSLRTLSEKALRHPNSDSVNYPLRDYINRSFGSIGIKPYTDDDGDIIRDESYFLDETERILDVLEKTKNILCDLEKTTKKKSFKFEKKEDNKTHLLLNDKSLIIENGFYNNFLELLKSLTKQTGGTKRRRKSMRKKSRKSLRKKTRRKRQ